MFHSIPLQRAQVVRVAQLGPQLFEDGPVPLLPLAADLALEVSLEIGGDVIVVDERVVHVDQEYDRMRGTHRGPAFDASVYRCHQASGSPTRADPPRPRSGQAARIACAGRARRTPAAPPPATAATEMIVPETAAMAVMPGSCAI